MRPGPLKVNVHYYLKLRRHLISKKIRERAIRVLEYGKKNMSNVVVTEDCLPFYWYRCRMIRFF
jgi:hypothetical protein